MPEIAEFEFKAFMI